VPSAAFSSTASDVLHARSRCNRADPPAAAALQLLPHRVRPSCTPTRSRPELAQRGHRHALHVVALHVIALHVIALHSSSCCWTRVRSGLVAPLLRAALLHHRLLGERRPRTSLSQAPCRSSTTTPVPRTAPAPVRPAPALCSAPRRAAASACTCCQRRLCSGRPAPALQRAPRALRRVFPRARSGRTWAAPEPPRRLDPERPHRALCPRAPEPQPPARAALALPEPCQAAVGRRSGPPARRLCPAPPERLPCAARGRVEKREGGREEMPRKMRRRGEKEERHQGERLSRERGRRNRISQGLMRNLEKLQGPFCKA
jgi:hypothetical protein